VGRRGLLPEIWATFHVIDPVWICTQQVDRDLVSNGAMWAHGVVVLAPSIDFSRGILDVEEPVLFQAFRSEPAAKGFAVGIVRWFSWS
jgi:hypothetical protein